MSVSTADIGYDVKHLMGIYPWESLDVVNVGGSHGFISVRIASDFSKICCIVQEFPEIVRDGKSKSPSESSESVTFMAQDFLTEQLVKNADVYFFHWIFHNWSDKSCIEILQNLIPALKNRAKVVVYDNCLPEPGVLGL
ncbi:hypothetical protein N7G274_001331 [Stereocaulon virgatum]|uniref:O-methyltransferase C-terminal domain-containing protein n=1 Tax=Stereocaulon virgatum TaxID=373712 RepID=A0ABR4APX9_9LECA